MWVGVLIIGVIGLTLIPRIGGKPKRRRRVKR